LNCFFPYQRLTLAHSFKDKSDRLEDVNSGLFSYPMLMAADILLYDADYVPVGKDQLQHLEMTRDVASRFNHKMGETFVVPKEMVRQETQLIPGVDGEKMSKSKGNTINIFDAPNALKKHINKNIITDATPLEDPKEPNDSVVWQLYQLVASASDADAMAEKLRAGGYGWGHAKKDLLDALVDGFAQERDEFNRWMNDKTMLDAELAKGAERARETAQPVLQRVRTKIGF
jgi:tryptophanyl-tRNA synthetase